VLRIFLAGDASPAVLNEADDVEVAFSDAQIIVAYVMSIEFDELSCIRVRDGVFREEAWSDGVDAVGYVIEDISELGSRVVRELVSEVSRAGEVTGDEVAWEMEAVVREVRDDESIGLR